MNSQKIIDFLQSRRSVRKFTNEQVSEEHIQTILRTAMLAPSAMNQQPWIFTIIDDQVLLEHMESIHKGAAMAAHAPVSILVSGNFENTVRPSMVPQDCSAAAMNILYAAHALGLGAVWCGIYPDEGRIIGMRRLLRVPKEFTPFGLVVIGHPEETAEQPDRWNESKIHRNRYSL